MVPSYELVVCGRLIGSASFINQVDDWEVCIYDFKPHPDYTGPNPDENEETNILYDRGLIQIIDEDGFVSEEEDLIQSIQNCPIDRAEDK